MLINIGILYAATFFGNGWDTYTQTEKYPPVCFLYVAIKSWFLTSQKMHESDWKFTNKCLRKYIGNHPLRNFSSNLWVVLKMPAFKVRSFTFYFIKLPFSFCNFDFESWYFLNQLKFFNKKLFGKTFYCFE